MQIQRGLVKYKDRSDIICTYGLTEEGKQYYFLDNTSMTNGNIIASTVLVEVIDPVVVASSIGVIDQNGGVVIPFVNKSIKPIIDGLLLVEIANSTTPSVVEANSLRSDPLAATKLVTTPATIKDKINVKMGSEGRFLFNDQFSEATVCDYNGNNILDNQYFSFIAIKNDTLYLCKNTVDSPVVEYSLSNRMFISPAEEIPSLDVKNTEVTQDTIDGAMTAEEKVVEFDAGDITAKNFEVVADEVSTESPMPVEPSVVMPNVVLAGNSDNAVTEGVVEANEKSDDEEPISVIPDEINKDDVVEQQIVEEPVNVEDSPIVDAASFNEETAVVPVEENSTETVVTEESVNDTSVDEASVPETSKSDNTTKENEESVPDELPTSVEDELAVETPVEVNEMKDNDIFETDNSNEKTDDMLMSFDFGDNINYSSDLVEESVSREAESSIDEIVSDFKNDLFDTDLNSDIFTNSTLHADKIDIDDSYSDFGYKVRGAKDTIIEDVASTMSNLIKQNKTQKQKIFAYEEKMNRAAVAYKKVVDKARNQLRDVEVLKNKLKNYETIVTKLETKLEVLENSVREQDKVIASQTRELESLRPQVEGKEELARILADAQSLLDQ